MKKIIRVTESELVKMIGKVINEQANVAPYYNFRTGQMAGKGAPAPAPAPAPGTAMDPNGDPTKFTQQKKLNIDCVGLKLPETNKTITGINGETFKFFNTGRFADVKGQKGNYTCGNQANIINLMYDSDPKAVKYFNMTPKAAPAKVKAKPDPKVIELQKQLVAYGFLPQSGVDGIMGPKTRAAQKLLIQQKGQVALQNLTAKGQEFKNQNIARINQYKAPVTPGVPAATAATAATDQPPTEPGSFGERRDGWQWSDIEGKWNKLQ